MLVLYKRPAASSGEYTLAIFEVSDLDATIDALIEKGVMMEQYNMPEMNLVTDERGIVAMGNLRTAWFKDSEGNVLGLGEQQ